MLNKEHFSKTDSGHGSKNWQEKFNRTTYSLIDVTWILALKTWEAWYHTFKRAINIIGRHLSPLFMFKKKEKKLAFISWIS